MKNRSFFGFLFFYLFCAIEIHAIEITEPYRLRISDREARDVLNLILEDVAFQNRATTPKRTESFLPVRRLLGAYRFNGDTTELAIKDSPFGPFLVGMQFDPIYAAAYTESYKKEYERVVVHTPVEIVLDGFMHAVIDGTVPDSFREQGDQVGKCLAKKVLAGNKPGCSLDPTEEVPHFLTQAWVKLSCPLGLATDCYSRQVVYRAARKDLEQSLTNPEIRDLIREKFNKNFPIEFRKQFLVQLDQELRAIPSLIVSKFQGEAGEEWTDRGRLFEAELYDRVDLHEVAAGIRADLGVAADLLNSAQPKDRSMAAALFFSAASRFIIIMGGKQIYQTKNGIEVAGYQDLDPKSPEKPQGAPIPEWIEFGGWGVSAQEQKTVYGPWDFLAYDPSKKFRAIPSIFKIFDYGTIGNARNVDPYESLEDMGELLAAGLDFLKLTKPNGPFGKYFGSSDLSAIRDPRSSVIFPAEGRKLVMGIIGVILKNLQDSKMGHVERVPGQIVDFHEFVDLFTGQNKDPARTAVVSRVLGYATEFSQIISGDLDAPSDLLASIPDIEGAVHTGVLVLVAKGQGQDGSFSETLGATRVTAPKTFRTAVAGMTAVTRGYNKTHTIAFRAVLRQEWKFFDQFWTEASDLPLSVLGDRVRPVSAYDAWAFIRLWNHTQELARKELENDIEWNHWQRRVDRIRTRLIEQLRSVEGPGELEP